MGRRLAHAVHADWLTHKCQVLHITHRKSPVKSPYNIHGHQLEEVEAAKNIYQCPKEIKVLCYNTLVRPIMEYGGIIWGPSTAHNINRLEMVQRRAARFIMGDYHTTSSVTTMMEQLGWRTLQERRAQAKAVMMFRIVNQLVDIPHTYLTPARVSVRGHSQRFTVPHTRTTTYRHSFFPDSIRIWNALPQDAISCNTLESFKASLQPLHLR
ncbi:hypothetical protein FSP39_016427 [Pinctada imbricata]|uniref:Uncharacterized protein n=1 Tax=Pinctada imbricata TaxID=66713 RepID=A0AA88YDI1_PINIB|nr:hypothetical protein FSP39_016427 [Pinctada imbricata]